MVTALLHFKKTFFRQFYQMLQQPYELGAALGQDTVQGVGSAAPPS